MPDAGGRWRWRRIDAGNCLQMRWAHRLDGDCRVDPYLVWAEQTCFRGFGGMKAVRDGLPFIVELVDKGEEKYVLPGSASGNVDSVFGKIGTIPTAYHSVRNSEGNVTLRYKRFTTSTSVSMVCEVMAEPAVARLQLGVPRLPANEGSMPPTSREVVLLEGTFKPRVVVGIIDDGCAFAHPALTRDDGTPRVHFLWDQNSRRDPGGQWYRNLPFPYGWELRHDTMTKASCTALRTGDTSMAYWEVQYAPVALGLDRHGTDPRNQPRDAMRTRTHGHSVTHLAVGIEGGRHPLDDQRALSAFDAASPRLDGAAGWPIVFVQLPTRTTLDTSGGSLAVHALDALHYIISRAERLPYDDGGVSPDGAARSGPLRRAKLPDETEEPGDNLYPENWILVNLSYGAIAGPHDGSSILEQALAEVVGTSGRFCKMTLAAGNAHRTRTHAMLSLAEGEGGELKWSVGPDHPFESFLEIWLPGADVRGFALSDADIANVFITVTPPDGSGSCSVRSGSGCLLADEAQQGGVVAGFIRARRVVQGLNGTMVLLTVARTRAPLLGECDEAGPVGPHGDWRVEIGWGTERGDSLSDRPTRRQVDIHAWAERNDLVFGNLRAQQGKVVADVQVPEPTEFTPEALAMQRNPGLRRQKPDADPMQPRYGFGSASGLAGWRCAVKGSYVLEPALLAVGAQRLADGEVSTYSSGGPARHVSPTWGGMPGLAPAADATLNCPKGAMTPRSQPELLAPADISVALPGLRVSGTRAGSYARLGGTSAAAPLVLRHLANEVFARVWGLSLSAPPWLQPSSGPDAARPTSTPQADDKYRRGWMIKPLKAP